MKLVMAHSPLDRLLSQLGGERVSFPHPASELKVLQTHISIVLLAGDFAYKIKKPVQFPFVDYSTLEKRRYFCALEVELNRRLARDIYLEVVPLSLRNGTLEVGGRGVPVEFAVKMKRLPDQNRLGQILQSGKLPYHFWDRLAQRLVGFYLTAKSGPGVSEWARPEAVEEDLRQLLSQMVELPTEVLHPILRNKIEDLALKHFEDQRELIKKRLPLAREGHGDLRLEHIYFFPGEPEPKDLILIDCVEFNPRYRCGDPLADIAFLLMDLETGGFCDEALRFKEAFNSVSGVRESALLDFYVAYRHLVRGLVRGLQFTESDGDSQYRTEAEQKARSHFLKAFGKLEPSDERPCLMLLGGLPGVGKSTLSERLCSLENFRTFSSDLTRKELIGPSNQTQPVSQFEKGFYKPEWTEKTYSTLLLRAEAALRLGHRVIVDASFWKEAWRKSFKNLALSWGVPFQFFVCTVGHQTAGQRLSHSRPFHSDADMEIYGKMAKRWEVPSPELGTLFLNTERPIQVTLSEIQGILAEKGLSKIGRQKETPRIRSSAGRSL